MDDATLNFIERAQKVHGDKYDYSEVKYINNRIKVEIICPKHGKFIQTPKDHLTGCGCPACYQERRGKIRTKTKDNFIKDAVNVHGNKYDYSKVEYLNALKPVIIICPEHGSFEMRPSNHLKGQGCPKCGKLKLGAYRKNNTENFIERATLKHNGKYDYSKVDYKNNYTKVCIICPEHGEFWQKPNDHLRGIGCAICGQKYNRIELEILNALKNKYGNVEYQHKEPFFASKTSYQTIDFFLPEYNIGIEYHGRQHFKPISKFGGEEGFEKCKERDYRKYQKCIENGIKIFYLTLEKCDTSNYFTKVFKNIDDLFNEIDKIINQNKITITSSDIKEIVNEVITKILSI